MSDVMPRQVSCAQCALPFPASRHKKYCSPKCKSTAAERRNGHAPQAEYAAARREGGKASFTCEHCGVRSYRKLGGKNKSEGYSSRWCSMQCRVGAAAAKAEPATCKVWAGYCSVCAAPYVGKRERKYCSDECRPKSIHVSIMPSERACAHCMRAYTPATTGGRPVEYCSSACSDLVAAARKRVHKAQRKALIRRVTVEQVDPFVVFERDGWECRICGVPTPQAKRGTYDSDAPELDHIIALAAGGEHSYRNTQCACRSCNAIKSDKPMSEMVRSSRQITPTQRAPDGITTEVHLPEGSMWSTA